MPLSKKDLSVLLCIAVAGRPACLVELRLADAKHRKERLLAFVPGNADAMDIDRVFDSKISSLTYSMDLAAGRARMADVNTKPEYQQYCLQQSLFAYALKDMLENGIKVAGLRWKGGKAAYDLYYKLGFRVVDRETKDMELRLSAYLVRKIYVRTKEGREEAIRRAREKD